MIKADLNFLKKVNTKNFAKSAMEIFKYQSKNNPVYAKYLDFLGIYPSKITSLKKVPFLPIELFKSHIVKTGNWKPESIFFSSGTTGARSSHFIRDLQYYLSVTEMNFSRFFGSLEDFEFYALLPGYTGNETNSLITMISSFIGKSKSTRSGFYMGEEVKLRSVIGNKTSKKKLLFGVSHALLDFSERFPSKLGNVIIMETGGMKGRREEITRQELHARLKQNLGVETIYSEYGMAELTSQAYSKGNGLFAFPPWMRFQLRDVTDPFQEVTKGAAGGINIIDLSNLNTCSFIEIKDLGRSKNGQELEILGRFDNSDLRGCNLLVI